MVWSTDLSAGIGQGRVTRNVQGAPVDYALLIKDAEAVEMVRVEVYLMLNNTTFFSGISATHMTLNKSFASESITC